MMHLILHTQANSGSALQDREQRRTIFRRISRALVGAACIIATPAATAPTTSPLTGFQASTADAQRDLEARFDKLLSPADLQQWLETMTKAPNHVGAPHNRANAELTLRQFREWGWDAKIETFDVWYPTPEAIAVELVAPKSVRAALHEPPVAGDRTSVITQGVLPPYVAYGGDGDVTAELVYVNYGMPSDYETLARNGISVKGKIVIARYGGGWRGLKPKLAQQHGAVGCLIYSDPADDGYGVDLPYPAGGSRPLEGVQRGSVLDLPVRPGDPLTPGVGATRAAKRIAPESAETILKIPVLPISYGDARPLLQSLAGNVAPRAWRGALPLTYRFGPGPAKVRVMVKSKWKRTAIHNVIATLKSHSQPDEWIIRGNHRDAWTFGAWDPLSGHVAMMAEAKAIGALARTGWRPKRTLVYASWDAEEPGLLGSTEWVEAHAEELRRKAVLYVNSDVNARGFLMASGSPALRRAVSEIASEVRDPQTGAVVRDRLRARLGVSGSEDRRVADAMRQTDGIPLEAMGSGSDFTAFIHHIGVASVQLYYGGENESGGVYHSLYDSMDYYSRFGDPGLSYGIALAQTSGRMVLRAAEADVLPFDFAGLTEALDRFVGEVRQLATAEEQRVRTRNQLVSAGSYTLAADPLRKSEPPATEPAPAPIDLTPLDQALGRLKAEVAKYEAAKSAALSSANGRFKANARLDRLLAEMEQAALDPDGLPGRPWYRNLLYAPGLYTGYGAKTLPGVREAIEEHRWDEVSLMIRKTADAFNRLSAQLAEATAELD